MSNNGYGNDYSKENDRFSSVDSPMPEKKTSFSAIAVVVLLLLIASALGYEYLLKPNLSEEKDQTEQEVVSTPREVYKDVVRKAKRMDTPDSTSSSSSTSQKRVRQHDVHGVLPSSGYIEQRARTAGSK